MKVRLLRSLYWLNPSVGQIFGIINTEGVITEARNRKAKAPEARNDIIALHLVNERFQDIKPGYSIDEAIRAITNAIDRNQTNE